MSAFGFITGQLSNVWDETTKNGKNITFFAIQFNRSMGDKNVPQARQIKAFSQKAIEKLYKIPLGSHVECRIELGGRIASDGRIYNDDTLDFDKIEVVDSIPHRKIEEPIQQESKQQQPQAAPKKTEPAVNTENEIDDDIPF